MTAPAKPLPRLAPGQCVMVTQRSTTGTRRGAFRGRLVAYPVPGARLVVWLFDTIGGGHVFRSSRIASIDSRRSALVVATQNSVYELRATP